MVDISIVNGIMNQLITWGAPPCASQLPGPCGALLGGGDEEIFGQSAGGVCLPLAEPHSVFNGVLDISG